MLPVIDKKWLFGKKKQTLIALEQLIFLAKIFQIKITLWSFVCVFFYLMLESALQEEYLIPWYPLNKHFQTSKHSNNYWLIMIQTF